MQIYRKRLRTSIKFIFVAIVAIFLSIISYKSANAAVVCPSAVNTSYKCNTPTDCYFLKCNGSTRYADVCYSQNPACSTPIRATVSVCGENETCRPLDAYSHCVECVPKQEAPIVSRNTFVSGIVSVTGPIPDSITVYMEISATGYTGSASETYNGGRSVGYSLDVGNTADAFGKQGTLKWTVTGTKNGTTIGEIEGYGSTDGNEVIGGSIYQNVSLTTTEPEDDGGTGGDDGGDGGSDDDSTDGDEGDGPGTNTCETTGLGGNVWSCIAQANCTSGVGYASSTNLYLYSCPSDKPQFCCKVTNNTGGTIPPSSDESPTTPTETCVYHGVSCGANGNADAIVKSGSTSETVPFKNGQFCGGTYHDVYECTNSSTGTKRLRYDRVASADAACAPGGNWCAVSTNPCQTRGGLKAGVPPVPLCGDQFYDSAQANKTQAQGNPYCGKEYTVNYHCSDNTWEARTTGFTPGICDAAPWCNTASTPPAGTGEACAGAPSAVGGNCPAAKPICNRSGSQGDCVAQGSVANGSFCANKNNVCQSGVCNDAACAAPIVGGNPSAPTPPPLNLDVYCPVVDTDGLYNSCMSTANCQAGYQVKFTDANHPSNKACDAHTSGQFKWCCHEKQPVSTPAPTGAALDPLCPDRDTDGKPNTCDPQGWCTPGYSHKNSAAADQACTAFRGTPSWCCHQN